MGYKVGDVMDPSDYQLPALNLDQVFQQIAILGGTLDDEMLDKAQQVLWAVKGSVPIIEELIQRFPTLLDTTIDGLQEAAARRGRKPVIKGVAFDQVDGDPFNPADDVDEGDKPWVGHPNRWGPEFIDSPCGSCGHNSDGDAMNGDRCADLGCEGDFNKWIPPPTDQVDDVDEETQHLADIGEDKGDPFEYIVVKTIIPDDQVDDVDDPEAPSCSYGMKGCIIDHEAEPEPHPVDDVDGE